MPPNTKMLSCLLLLAACGKEIDREKAATLFDEIKLDTKPGLSGLASDVTGALWTIAERDEVAYRITLTGLTPKLDTFAVTDAPPGLDLEGIAVLGEGKFALGTEGRVDGEATVLLAELRDGEMHVTKRLDLPAERIGLELPANHGAEGVCGANSTILAAIEETGSEAGKRWAPIVRITEEGITHVNRLWLTTKTGKISGLDCTIDKDGTAHAIAIERHFEVTKLLRFDIPNADGDLTATEVLDLGPVLHARLNLEGIAEHDGKVFAVVDNQWKTLQGPSLLLAFKPGVVKTR
jgi:hypothetical protein